MVIKDLLFGINERWGWLKIAFKQRGEFLNRYMYDFNTVEE